MRIFLLVLAVVILFLGIAVAGQERSLWASSLTVILAAAPFLVCVARRK